ncbi:MAG: hypothetical protein A2341_04830 [Deltaproteobacteria bacterium RIFOXYB12_FULL_58_9]|nr:MAG: hypothetical protein A2341_04830 [Deltaproteobacteria bacterium RIFOXYB12_FULL_58_9]
MGEKRKCAELEELFNRKLDGDELELGEENELAAHLAQCPSCAQHQADMVTMLGAATELGDLKYERDISLSPLVLQSRRPSAMWGLGLGWVAAALLLGLYLGRGTETLDKDVPAAVTVRLVVPAGEANSVEVVGDFTGWQKRLPLQRANNGFWVGEIKVQPGRYEYMIVVDGENMRADPAAPQMVDDGFGGQNSVLDVGSI